MREWDEKRIDEELEALLHNMPEQDALEERINRSINHRIRKTVVHTLSGVVIVLMIAFLLINPLLNYSFLNPYKLNLEPEQKILGVLRDYCETVHPYREITNLEVKKKGFARYELEMEVTDLTKPLTDGVVNVWFDINFSVCSDIKDADSTLALNTDRFSQTNTNKEDTIIKISELPKSAVIYLSVSEITPKPIETLRNMAVTLEWFQVYQPNVEFQGGMNYQPRMTYAEDDRREEMTEQELIEAYVSNLENMMYYDMIWAGLSLDNSKRDTMYYNHGEEILRDTWKDATLLTSLTSENYCVYGKRDEIIQFLQENTFDSILIENVNLW